MAKNTNIDPSIEVMNTTPPIDGGNTNAIVNNLKAIASNIGINNITKKEISNAIRKTNLNFNKTYNVWWLLQFQADYFSNLVNYKLDDYQINRQVGLAIRLGVIYGCSILWKHGEKITAMYVNSLELDEEGYPLRARMYRGDMVLLNQSMDLQNMKLNWIDRDVSNEDEFFVFIANDVNLGGLLKWMPFLNTLETLLQMLNTHSYSYLKTILYNVRDKKSFLEDLELFFDANNPFLINTMDENVLANRFKEFEIHKGVNTADGLINFIKDFLNIYYDLIGRRYNSDKKKERNIASEVEATQENFDILQRTLVRNIIYMLEFVEKKWGFKNEIDSMEELDESDDDIPLKEKAEEFGSKDGENNDIQ